MRRLTWVLIALLFAPLLSPAAVAQDDRMNALAIGNSTFAFDLYASLQEESDGNIVFSPFSVSQALAMTWAGARGQTADQMAAVLSFTLDQSSLADAFATLNADLLERGTGEADESNGTPARALRVANALWGEETYPFSADFSALLQAAFGAGIQPTDFINDPKGARQRINDWVAEQTEGRITDIIPDGVLDTTTRLVLANAIYFYGGWQSTFDESFTSDEEFHLLNGETIAVPMMEQIDHFPYLDGDGFQVVDFPYAESGLTFSVLLPDEGSFDQFETTMTLESVSLALNTTVVTEIDVYLPRFEFEYQASLANVLKAMGMTDAFDSSADFSGMMEGQTGEPLVISEVLHKAFIGVDENGTEAAAATAVIMAAGAAAPDETVPPEVRIDRPFIFLIRDTKTGTILFLGRVLDPSV